MITFLRGVLCPSPPSRLYIDVGGVGHEVLVPFTTGPSIGRPGDTVTVLTYFHVREQEQTLYGFQTDDERDLFRLLIDRVSGVGPKVALSILSGLAVDDFKRAVVDSDIATLSAIKGLGKKTAERIILELKDKVGVAEAWQNAAAGGSANPTQQITNDTILALIALGYKQVEASKAVRAEAGDTPPADLDSQDLLRRALRRLQ
jgi:Holliday junction DNA helicase RuvA